MRDTQIKPTRTGVVLGEDWVSPERATDADLRDSRARRGLISINRSPLARKIIVFNLIGLIVLVAGVLFLTSFRENFAAQRERAMVVAAEMVAGAYEVQQASGEALDPATAQALLVGLSPRESADILVFDAAGALLARAEGGTNAGPVVGLAEGQKSTLITDMLSSLWDTIAGLFTGSEAAQPADHEALARAAVAQAYAGTTAISRPDTPGESDVVIAVTPIVNAGTVTGAVALVSSADEVGELVRAGREQILQMFVVAILVSITLSLVLASTIANPISDLAAAAELSGERSENRVAAGRVRIPDLSARPDEIGRLSKSLRNMVAALYDRIDANEQFAADVAHEIKNPLASLRSAVGTMRVAKRDDQREKLLDVIDHDVRRLDRLVSDISNASRLDAELVKEEEETFDLLKMLGNLTEYLGEEARAKGVDFITDLPRNPIIIQGLEARLAQVFVNLITNATSFCEDGDAIRVWARQRENRVLVVVEDTGPGIPEEALTKVFNRFYSERPENQFGNNSGLGLAISKQIVEAHGGVIWAENIRPTDADITSEPLGARFVVGLPV